MCKLVVTWDINDYDLDIYDYYDEVYECDSVHDAEVLAEHFDMNQDNAYRIAKMHIYYEQSCVLSTYYQQNVILY